LSVLKNQGIDLTSSEKKTLKSFFILYIVFTLVIVSLMSSLYYTMQKELKIQENVIILNDYTNDLTFKLETLDTTKEIFPNNNKIKVSLYNKNYELVYSTFEQPSLTLDKVEYTNNKIIRYIKNPKKSYLNTQYIVAKILNNNWQKNIIINIIIYSSLFFTLMLIIGYYILNLFLKPMKNSIKLLDNFIKDTTHELNTPISTIGANIELINTLNFENKLLQKSINRIDIAAKTISNIYDDLTYMILNNKIISKNENINLEGFINQRAEYFKSLLNIKKISINVEIKDNIVLFIDRNKLSKLIDNILSNAIKYNNINGKIDITLKNNTLYIKDNGIGIRKENLDKLLQRYSRFNDTVGGFGIGLSIVKMICDEYNLNISISSKYKEFTLIKISFHNHFTI